jgi:hypothetical protein
VPPTTLYRLAGLAGMLSGLLLLFNTARRGGVVPANALTHGIAPLSSVLGLFALTGLYLWQRQQSGPLGLVGDALNLAGLAGTTLLLTAVLYVVGLVPVALRGVLPEPAVAVGLILAAAGTAWLSAALWRTASRDANAPATPRSVGA